jgi:hypothetical protein
MADLPTTYSTTIMNGIYVVQKIATSGDWMKVSSIVDMTVFVRTAARRGRSNAAGVLAVFGKIGRAADSAIVQR